MNATSRARAVLRNSLHSSFLGAAAAASLAAASPASAAATYSENVSGDLSNSGLAPTAINLAFGNNLIEGSTGLNSAGAIDSDYFTFTLAAGQALDAIEILTGTTTLGFSFIGVQSGNQLTLDPASADATGLLGWYHYSGADVGSDILDNMGTSGAGSTGFTGPLGPGTYSFWVQEASPGTPVRYKFNFIVGNFVGEVPEPATWAMMLLGFGAVGYTMRRRRRRHPLLMQVA
jgi:hypothetical protein